MAACACWPSSERLSVVMKSLFMERARQVRGSEAHHAASQAQPLSRTAHVRARSTTSADIFPSSWRPFQSRVELHAQRRRRSDPVDQNRARG
jgi:hypothetical protein